MDIHLVVDGLITRHSVLNPLLRNYADHLQHGNFGQAARTAPGFIVPTWTADPRPSAPPRSELLMVEVHVFLGDPDRYTSLDTTVGLLHSVLADADGSSSITSRCLGTSADVLVSDLATIFKVATWQIAPTASQDPTAPPSLIPWPCRGKVTTAAFSAPGREAINMN